MLRQGRRCSWQGIPQALRRRRLHGATLKPREGGARIYPRKRGEGENGGMRAVKVRHKGEDIRVRKYAQGKTYPWWTLHGAIRLYASIRLMLCEMYHP
jgi:hypothetical protein